MAPIPPSITAVLALCLITTAASAAPPAPTSGRVKTPPCRHRILSRSSGLARVHSPLSGSRPRDPARRHVLVMDIDNTQTDARARTRQLLLRFAHAHQLPLPPELPLETIHYDGRESALALGWSQTQADAFHRRWSEAFWQGSSLSYDQGIAPIQRIARQAARAGREIFHLTGRDTSSRAATLAQLQRLRIPFAKRNHVLTKKPGESTVAFKRRQLKRLRARGYVIDYFLTDSYAEIAAVSDLDIKALLVDFPVAQRRPPKKALHALQVLSIRP